MTRDEELALQKEYLKTHPCRQSQEPVAYHPPQKKDKKHKTKKHRVKQVSRGYKKALRRNKRGLITQITRSERRFKGFLDALEIKYNFQRIFIVAKKGYIVDFFLPDYSMVIEIDGNNHSETEQDKKDYTRTEDLLKIPLIKQVLRYDNEEVSAMNVMDVCRNLTIKICPFSETLME